MPKPLIGVTVSKSSPWWVYPLYALAILRAGGRAVRWSDAGALDVDAVDGVVVGAGDPSTLAFFDGGLSVRSEAQQSREVLDTWALKVAFADAKPVLAVGFGMERLNAALGGRVADDGAPKRARWFDARRITPLPRSALAEALGGGPFNAPAPKGCDFAQLGLGMHVAARDGSGDVQAIERARAPFAMGVQWRPELSVFDARQQGLFRAFVGAAAEKARTRAAQALPALSTKELA